MAQSIRFRVVFPVWVGICFALAWAVEEGRGQSRRDSRASFQLFLDQAEQGGKRMDYVPNEILVKFRKEAAEKLAFELGRGKQVSQIQIADSLAKINQKYPVCHIRNLFGRFKEDQNKIRAIQRKDKALLSPVEKRLLRRLQRASKGVRVPELDRIYKLTVDIPEVRTLS